MSSGDLALGCASALVDELARAGVRHACVSPGSRSTPLALAVARHPGITVHVHLDERSAAFFALGTARATGRPAAVICTSGTAAANLHPAVVEARQAGVPLVVLTADRPHELRDTGANQTIDQIKLYGDAVRAFVEAPLPEPGAGAMWRSLGSRAVSVALGPPAGPVHVNLPFREPLTPTGAAVDLGADADGRPDGEPWERWLPPARHLGAEDADRLARALDTDRGLVVAGGLPPWTDARAVLDLADHLGWPVVAEPHSGLRLPGRALSAGVHVASPGGRAPEVVLQVGAAPTSRTLQRLCAAAQRLVVVDPGDTRPDPSRRAVLRVGADPARVSEAVAARLPSRDGSAWLESWRTADRAARLALDVVLEGAEEPSELRLARDVAAAVPDGGWLVCGSSTPIRDLDAAMAPRTGLRVVANRGASGIDGFVSTALGVAAATGEPVVALCGDLTLLHDAGALLWAARGGPDAVFVVPDNGGGAIFDLLPQSVLPEAEELFVTPHGCDLAALAGAARASHTRVEKASALDDELTGALRAGGRWILEVPIDRARSHALRREAMGAAAGAVGGR